MQTTAKERMLDAQAQYEIIKEDNEKLAAFRDSMSEIFARMEKLQDYYLGEWINDMDELNRSDENIEVMGQDPIYEEIVEQDKIIKEILLNCAQYLN